MIVWWLHLQLPMQSVPITTKVISSNATHGEVYLEGWPLSVLTREGLLYNIYIDIRVIN
jgi:arginine/ornithine N-succinyltransferase beta subunit